MSMNTVYVTGLPPNVRVREVYELFIKQCGKVKYADFLPADDVCIQVRFDDPGDFEKCHRRTDLQLEGSNEPLKILIRPPPGVNRAQNNKGKQGKGDSKGNDGGKGKGDYQAGGASGSKQFAAADRKGDGKGKAVSSASIWVGNLPPGVTDDRLKEEFQRFGTIRSIVTRGLADKRMFAYVNFTSVSSAESAIEKMHRSDAFGDPINVSFSKNPPRAPDGGAAAEDGDGDVLRRRIDLRPGPNAKGSGEGRKNEEANQGGREVHRSDARGGAAAATTRAPAQAAGRGERRDGRPNERDRDRRDHGDRDHGANDRDRRGQYRDRPREHDRGYDRDRNRDRERGRERDNRERDRDRDRTRRDVASRSRSRRESRGRRDVSHDRRASRRDDHQESATKRRRTGSGEPRAAAEKESRRRTSAKEQDDDDDGDEDEDDAPVAKTRSEDEDEDDEEEEEQEPRRTTGASRATSARKAQTATKPAVEEPSPPRKKAAKKAKPVAKKLLKIENLPPDMTQEELRTTASDFGNVLLCEITSELIDGGREGTIEYERQAELELALKKLDRRRVEGWEKRLHALIVDDR